MHETIHFHVDWYIYRLFLAWYSYHVRVAEIVFCHSFFVPENETAKKERSKERKKIYFTLFFVNLIMTNNNFTDEKVNNEIAYIPVINPDNTCVTDNNVIIYNCTMDEKGNITGFTDKNVKALYRSDKGKWFLGKEIGFNNLISLTERTEEERKAIVKRSHEKAKENREREKDFNSLAKAMIEQVLTDRQVKDIVGDKKNFMIDNSLGSALLNAMINSALDGSFKAFESVRDTAGYKPTNKSEIDLSADIMTEADKSLIDKALKTG